MTVAAELPVIKHPVALPGFEVTESTVSEEAIQAYERDGVVWLRSVYSRDWVDLLAEGMEVSVANAGDNTDAFNIAAPGEPGFFYYDTFMWRRIEQFRRFCLESHAPDIAMQVMRSKTLIFYFDFMLLKEPGTSRKTPWHYDEAYWPVAGEQICNQWIAIDRIPVETALRFVRGSHLMRDQRYRSVHFDPDDAYARPEDLPAPPDWDCIEGDHEIVYAPMDPGDCLVFHSRTHHSAPGNLATANRRRALATHWIGDDITYNDKPIETDPPQRGEGLVHGGSMECALFPRVR